MRRIPTAIGLLTVLAAALIALGCGPGRRTEPLPAPPRMTADPAGQPLDPADAERIERLARTDHVELLKLCLQHHLAAHRDYTCTLTKQERIGEKLGPPQVIDIRFKQQPFSVLMTWTRNPTRGDKILYVENDPDGRHRMYIHPTGLAGRLVKSVERWPDDPEATAMSLRRVDQFGFARSLQALIDVYEHARPAGHLLEAGFVGRGEVDGRPTWVLKRVLARPNARAAAPGAAPAAPTAPGRAATGDGRDRPQPASDYPAKVTITELDAEYLVPVRVQGLDWDDRLSSEYTFTDLRFNVGLADEQFTRHAAGL